MEAERPQQGYENSTTIWRINSTAIKVNEAFEKARIEARDECLWLAEHCRALLAENDGLRVQIENLNKQIISLERTADRRGDE